MDHSEVGRVNPRPSLCDRMRGKLMDIAHALLPFQVPQHKL